MASNIFRMRKTRLTGRIFPFATRPVHREFLWIICYYCFVLGSCRNWEICRMNRWNESHIYLLIICDYLWYSIVMVVISLRMRRDLSTSKNRIKKYSGGYISFILLAKLCHSGFAFNYISKGLRFLLFNNAFHLRWYGLHCIGAYSSAVFSKG